MATPEDWIGHSVAFVAEGSGSWSNVVLVEVAEHGIVLAYPGSAVGAGRRNRFYPWHAVRAIEREESPQANESES